jgi:PhnB protein
MIRGVYPYLCIRGAAAALDFYRDVFGAEPGLRWDGDDGTVAHAEFRLGDTTFMVSDEYPEMGIRGPGHWGGTPVRLHLHVDDVDGLARRAEAAGAEILRGPRDEAHGERQCLLRDPWGHLWLLGDGEE